MVILLSIFNGEKYLFKQIESILNQSYEGFKLMIRDDGSSDNSISIIRSFRDSRIILIEDELGNLGVKKSFDLLVKTAPKSNLYFFSDQDDVWKPNKLQEFLKKYEENATEEPTLFFSDANIIDEDDEMLHSSFYSFNKVKPNFFTNGIFRGFIPGCSMAFNDKLRDLYLKINLEGTLHDFKIYILAYIEGLIIPIDQPLFSYRIHNTNTLGLSDNKIPIKVAILEVLKYFFQRKRYRNINLNNYFILREELEIFFGEQKMYEKKVHSEKEITELSFFERKKWYYTHFVPFTKHKNQYFTEIFLV